MSIGKKIQILRKQVGITQSQLAEKLGLKQQAITDYETGRNDVPTKRLMEIAVILGVKPAELLDLDIDSELNKKSNLISPSSRKAKAIKIFDELTPTEQRAALGMMNALIAGRKKAS